MVQLFLVAEQPDVENLKALLAEAKAERKRLQDAYEKSVTKVKRLQRQLARVTGNRRHINWRGQPKKMKVRDSAPGLC